MNRPVLTICIPVYNTAPYIEQCVDSVLAQNSSDWVLLISDNCSTDGTWEILQKYKHPRIQLFRQAENIGPRANWNFLLEQANTEYFCMLGADDYFYPDHVESKLRLLEEHPEAPLAHSRADHIDETGTLIPRPAGDEPPVLAAPPVEPSREALQRLLVSGYINITSVVFRRSALEKHGLNFSRRYRFFGDWALYVALALFYPCFIFDPKRTNAYRFHSANDTAKNIRTFQWTMEGCVHFLDSFAAHPDLWASYGFDTRAESKRLTISLWLLAFQQARRGQFSNARDAWQCYRQYHSTLEAIREFQLLVQKRLQRLWGKVDSL